MAKSLNEWLSEGESIYSALLEEYQRSEAQIAELQSRLSAMIEDVNQIAEVIGKPTIVRPTRQVELVEGSPGPSSSGAAPTPSSANIARALTGNVAVKVL